MNEESKKLSSKELYDLKKKEKEQAKKSDRVKEKINVTSGKIGKYTLYILVVIGVIGGITWLVPLAPKLPPTSAQNHSESSPSAHVVTDPISDNTQRHMLEHSDGNGSPGIIIQYNCDDYECEVQMLEQLTSLVNEYPENVYLAPNNYDGKIILTKLGKREILDGFDAQRIRNFIE